MNKLLNKAKSYRRSNKGHFSIEPTKDELEVVLAYLRGEIRIRAYAEAIGLSNPGNASHRVGTVLRYGLDNGYIEIRSK